MVISRITDGLGNQLFQYAMGRSLAQRRGVAFKIDTHWFTTQRDIAGLEAFTRPCKLDAFNVTAPVASAQETARFLPPVRRKWDPRRVQGLYRRLRSRLVAPHDGSLVCERGINFDPRLLTLPADVYLSGYWQSEHYFRDQADLIRQEFTLRDELLRQRAAAWVAGLRAEQRSLVSVHVRRGDIARVHEGGGDVKSIPYPLLPRDYFLKAMATFTRAAFIVFSDTKEDIAWCRANLAGANVHYSDAESEIFDFAAMSACDHHVISNSSFSWWAAWLNRSAEKIVVAPRTWFYRHFFAGHDIHSLIPSGWVMV